MNVLLIIVIALAVVHLCVFIYARFFDINSNKETSLLISMMEESVKQYVENTRVLNKRVEDLDELVKKKYDECNEITKMYNTVVHYLPNVTQKKAMAELVSKSPADDGDAKTVGEYLKWVSLIKYDDETDHTLTEGGTVE